MHSIFAYNVLANAESDTDAIWPELKFIFNVIRLFILERVAQYTSWDSEKVLFKILKFEFDLVTNNKSSS